MPLLRTELAGTADIAGSSAHTCGVPAKGRRAVRRPPRSVVKEVLPIRQARGATPCRIEGFCIQQVTRQGTLLTINATPIVADVAQMPFKDGRQPEFGPSTRDLKRDVEAIPWRRATHWGRARRPGVKGDAGPRFLDMPVNLTVGQSPGFLIAA